MYQFGNAKNFAVFSVVGTVLMLCASCAGTLVARNTNDTTPPTLTLTVTASTNTADGIEVVAPGSTVRLISPGGSAFIKADDPDGVAWVELWMTEEKDCGGVKIGPGLAGAPTTRVVGNLTDTTAPASLTAGTDINLLNLVRGCRYTFEVWGKAANAASNPAIAELPFSRLIVMP